MFSIIDNWLGRSLMAAWRRLVKDAETQCLVNVQSNPNDQTFQTRQFHHEFHFKCSSIWRFLPDNTPDYPLTHEKIPEDTRNRQNMFMVNTKRSTCDHSPGDSYYLGGGTSAQPKWYLPFLFQQDSSTTRVRTHYRRAPAHHGQTSATNINKLTSTRKSTTHKKP